MPIKVIEGRKGHEAEGVMVDKARVVSGIFSVYEAAMAKNFRDFDRYPIGFEAIFRNDASGRAFAENMQASLKNTASEKAILYHLEGSREDSARQIDCFFKDVDTFRRVLNDALPNMVLMHEEQGLLPKTTLIDQAKRLGKARALCA